jgi:subtilisin family serine protease
MSACVPISNNVLNLKEMSFDLFSNRPENPKNFIGIVTLKNPPLLDFAKKNDKGDFEIDQKVVDAVLKEQAEFEANLEKVAPSVKIIFRYRHVLNGYAVHGLYADMLKLKGLGYLEDFESESLFLRPIAMSRGFESKSLANGYGWDKANSVKHIGAEKLHDRGFKGKGLKVGIIDTGIDYTHSMLGGSGNVDAFTQMDVSKPSTLFPNKKVVGGVDLVGTRFKPGSLRFSDRIPIPDENPIDEAGHGTHVAGTVAGLGDGLETYSGVAPEAELYAIKVFGKAATSDFVVIAGFEYAVDPNRDMNINDRLDVVNLSLGGSFGGPKILYSEVIERLVQKADMIVVGAAGNSGPIDYVTGAPAATTDAFSVAASIDSSLHNWQLPGVKLTIDGAESITVVAPVGEFGKSPFDFDTISGELVPVGLANTPLPPSLEERVKGKVALIQRGGQPFALKAKHAEQAGAIGVVVFNDREGDPFRMGGKGSVGIPVVMVSQQVGLDLVKQIDAGRKVTVEFGANNFVSKPHLIDTIADFSSKGPRSDDLLIKPEVSAPGENIQSALMGGGNKGVQFSGTSMAAPHIAGAMALLKQAFPKLSASQLKNLMMNTALPIQTKDKKRLELVTLQGAGRVQLDQALSAKGLVEPPALSIGLAQLDQRKRLRSKVTYTNLSDKDVLVKVSLDTVYSKAVSLASLSSFVAPANRSIDLYVDFDILASAMENGQELDGWVVFESPDSSKLRVPFLMIPKKTSALKAIELNVFSDKTASRDAAAELVLTNSSSQKGRVKLFNLLGQDGRKEDPSLSKHRSKNCDIQSVGYRIVKIDGRELLQLAVKLYNPVTHWSRCEVVALIDSTGDGKADQELGYITAMNVPGMTKALGGNPLQSASVLFSSAKVQELRKEALSKAQDFGEMIENYVAAVEDVSLGYGEAHSTVVILEAQTVALGRQPSGKLSIKVASQDYSGLAVEFDDFFNPNGNEDWMTLSLEPEYQGFKDLPQSIEVAGNSREKVQLIKGAGAHDLLVIFPDNEVNFSEVIHDQQQEILLPKFW